MAVDIPQLDFPRRVVAWTLLTRLDLRCSFDFLCLRSTVFIHVCLFVLLM